MFRCIVLLCAAATAGLSGCSEANSYAAAESGLREWLTAVHDGDPAACELMTTAYRRELASGSGDGETSCAWVVRSATSGAMDGLPAADAEMEVPAWDPSGEALVEATDGQRVQGFWMVFQDERWLVAGTA